MLNIKSKQDLTGKTFNRLEVLKLLEVDESYKRNHKWLTKCDCGEFKETNSYCLKYKKTQSCGCLQRENFLKSTVKYTDNYALNSLVYEYKLNSDKRNLDFQLSHEECEKLFYQNCYYCNSEPLSVRTTKSKFPHKIIYNGIDRVDNNKGYTMSNVVSCCKICNVSKRSMDIDSFYTWVNKIYNNLKKNNIL